jgi:hypothetical protein
MVQTGSRQFQFLPGAVGVHPSDCLRERLSFLARRAQFSPLSRSRICHNNLKNENALPAAARTWSMESFVDSFVLPHAAISYPTDVL